VLERAYDVFKTSMAISPEPAKFAPLLFAGDWEHGLETAAELGYNAVEVSLRDPQTEVVRKLGKAVRSSGLAVSAIATGQSYYNDGLSPVSPDPAIQARLLDRMKGHVDLAATWGAMVIVGGVRGTFEGEPKTHAAQRQRAVEAIRRYTEYARSQGVLLAIEPINRYETNFINTLEEALGFIEEVDIENLVVLADTFHMNIEEVSIARSFERAGEKLGYIHFVDSNRWAAGQGHIDFRELAAVLQKIGYRGYICAEILPLPDSRTAAKLAIDYFHSL
jgi:sugar phosphate isomerase/epimerase